MLPTGQIFDRNPDGYFLTDQHLAALDYKYPAGPWFNLTDPLHHLFAEARRWVCTAAPSVYLYTYIDLHSLAAECFKFRGSRWVLDNIIPGRPRAWVENPDFRLAKRFRLGSLHMPTSINQNSRGDRSKLTSTVSSISSPAVPTLNNVITVPDEALFGLQANQLDTRIGAGSVPKALSLNPPVIFPQNQFVVYTERDSFVRRYGQSSPAQSTNVEVNAPTALFARPPRCPLQDIQHLPRERHEKEVPFAPIRAGINPVSMYFDNTIAREDLDAADRALATHRFGDDRGNRQVNAWAAQSLNRHTRMRTLANESTRGQRYFTMFFHLWRRYLIEQMRVSREDFNFGGHPIAFANHPTMLTLRNQTPDNLGFLPRPDDNRDHIATNLRFTFLSANIPPGLQNMVDNPEAPLWAQDGALIHQISEGRAAFIDVSHFIGGQGDLDRLRLLIMALAPQASHSNLEFSHPHYGLLNPGIVNPLQRIQCSLPFQRDPTGVTHFVLHFGQEEVPDQPTFLRRLMGWQSAPLDDPADPDAQPDIAPIPANNPYHRLYEPSLIYETISLFATYHHSWADAWDALDAIMYRVFMFHPTLYNPDLAPANVPNAALTCFGSNQVFLPRNYTLPAYFDVFREITPEAEFGRDVAAFARLTIHQQLLTARLAGHAHATSLTWVARSMSFNGSLLNAMAQPPPALHRNERQHLRAFTYRALVTQINAWSQLHSAATFSMYGFSPSPSTLLTTRQIVDPNYARPNTAIFLSFAYHSMWALKLLPHSYLLPTPDSIPAWPSQEDRPTINLGNIEGVRVARDLTPFLNVEYVQDGGMIANLQHYFCSRSEDSDSYRYADGPDLLDIFGSVTLNSWAVPSQTELPRAPAQFRPISIYPPGREFSDYIAPIYSNFFVNQGRELAFGLSINPGIPAATNRLLQTAWYRLSAQDISLSLSYSYIHPTATQLYDPNVNLDYNFNVFYGNNGDLVSMDIQPAPQVTFTLPATQLPVQPTLHVPQSQAIGLPIHLANAQPPSLAAPPAHPKPTQQGKPYSKISQATTNLPLPTDVNLPSRPNPPVTQAAPSIRTKAKVASFGNTEIIVPGTRSRIKVASNLLPGKTSQPSRAQSTDVAPDLIQSSNKHPASVGGIVVKLPSTSSPKPIVSKGNTATATVSQHNPTTSRPIPPSAQRIEQVEHPLPSKDGDIPVEVTTADEIEYEDLQAWVAGASPDQIPEPTDNSAREVQQPILAKEASPPQEPLPILKLGSDSRHALFKNPVAYHVRLGEDGFYHQVDPGDNPEGTEGFASGGA